MHAGCADYQHCSVPGHEFHYSAIVQSRGADGVRFPAPHPVPQCQEPPAGHLQGQQGEGTYAMLCLLHKVKIL